MKFAYILLADAANVSNDGKANLLGAGFHRVNVPAFPATVPMVVAGSVEATNDEAGDYRFRVEMKHPQGGWTLVVDDPVTVVTQDDVPPEIPRGVNFQIGLATNFDTPGLYRIRASIGSARARYVFIVRISADQQT